MFQWSFKWASRMFKRSSIGVLGKVSDVFQGCFKEEGGVLQAYLKEVQRVFQWIFKAVSQMF